MSANKTTNYKLHAWAPGDDFLRQEFNENFAKIDGMLSSTIITGTYQGNNAITQNIVLGFYPRAVLVVSREGRMRDGDNVFGGLALRGAVTEPKCSPPAVMLTTQGFQVAQNINGSWVAYTNNADLTYYYVALA